MHYFHLTLFKVKNYFPMILVIIAIFMSKVLPVIYLNILQQINAVNLLLLKYACNMAR
jgi:hypothetical protein